MGWTTRVRNLRGEEPVGTRADMKRIREAVELVASKWKL
jgi:hypothetical protein